MVILISEHEKKFLLIVRGTEEFCNFALSLIFFFFACLISVIFFF